VYPQLSLVEYITIVLLRILWRRKLSFKKKRERKEERGTPERVVSDER
jgi:hypothetical protein